jgi:hypothetical protein
MKQPGLAQWAAETVADTLGLLTCAVVPAGPGIGGERRLAVLLSAAAESAGCPGATSAVHASALLQERAAVVAASTADETVAGGTRLSAAPLLFVLEFRAQPVSCLQLRWRSMRGPPPLGV